MIGSTSRFTLAALLILSAAIFLQAHSSSEIFTSRVPLKAFPEKLGPWTGIDLPLEKDVLEVLGPGDFLLREYRNAESPQPGLNLFIAYFPSQRTGDTLHSPQHCLPGAGWGPVENKHVTLDLPGHVPFPANRYLMAKGESRQLVLYWYWAHDRGVASEYWAKYYLVADSIKMNRSDGALVRVITPMLSGESADVAQQRVMPFAASLQPLLDTYIPR